MEEFENQVTESDGQLFIKLTQDYTTFVDDTPEIRNVLENHRFVAHMSASGNPYARCRVYHSDGQRTTGIYLHHFVLPREPGQMIDHINRNTLDNRRCNLRNVSRSINMLNQDLRQTNTTGVKGLSRLRRPAWNVKWSDGPLGTSYNKCFLDEKYGGTIPARRAAIMHMNEMKSKIPRYAASGWTPDPID
jgi:hypothetical protein